jgi:hypothetical protein
MLILNDTCNAVMSEYVIASLVPICLGRSQYGMKILNVNLKNAVWFGNILWWTQI